MAKCPGTCEDGIKSMEFRTPLSDWIHLPFEINIHELVISKKHTNSETSSNEIVGKI